MTATAYVIIKCLLSVILISTAHTVVLFQYALDIPIAMEYDIRIRLTVYASVHLLLTLLSIAGFIIPFVAFIRSFRQK